MKNSSTINVTSTYNNTFQNIPVVILSPIKQVSSKTEIQINNALNLDLVMKARYVVQVVELYPCAIGNKQPRMKAILFF